MPSAPMPPSPRRAFALSALTLLGVAAVVSAIFVLRWVYAAGIFDRFAPVSPGACRVLASVPGPEDFEIDQGHRLMLISSTDRHAATPSRQDGIYAVALDDPAAKPVRLAGTPKDFHPHGISLYRGPDGNDILYAVNHHADGGQSVDGFAVAFNGNTVSLTARASIAGGLLVSPNDLFAIGPDRFYVTNDHVTRTKLGRLAEDYLLWPHADVLFFDGRSFHIAIQRIAFPNGVFVTHDGSHLYVTSTNERRLIAFSRDPFTGNLAEIGSLSIPARLDNISMDKAGDLVIPGHPSLPRVWDFQKDPNKPSPSVVFRVHLDPAGAPTGYETIYANDGAQIGASSSAAISDGHLYIGSVLDNKVLDCRLK